MLYYLYAAKLQIPLTMATPRPAHEAARLVGVRHLTSVKVKVRIADWSGDRSCTNGVTLRKKYSTWLAEQIACIFAVA